MQVNEIRSKSILIKRKEIDSWFLGGYGMNLYRGCTHGCVYCDGQAESYRVEGQFGQDVGVKVDAPAILRKELDPARRRGSFNRGFVVVGGGVGDSYQPAEYTYRLTRGVLELLETFGHPAHILTKSTLILRDLDILKRLNQKARVIVSFSFSSVDADLCSVFEPGVPPPAERLEAIRQLKQAGLTCGMFLMPVIPYLSDGEDRISASITQAKQSGIDFVICGGMTLKEGRQKEYFNEILRRHHPELVDDYRWLYRNGRWGEAGGDYYQQLNQRFSRVIRKHNLPLRINVRLCKPYVSRQELVCLILNQIDYLQKMQGRRSSAGYAAYRISRLPTPMKEPPDYTALKGIAPEIKQWIEEILETGDCRDYQLLMNYGEEKDGNHR